MAPFGHDMFTVRNHGEIKSESFSTKNDYQAVAGIRVVRPNRTPQFAHLTAWNTQHPTMVSV